MIGWAPACRAVASSTVHLKIPVTGEADHAATRVGDLGRDGRRQAVAHGARLRREQPRPRAKAEEFVRPDGEIPRAVGQHHVFGQALTQEGHDSGHIDR